MNAQTYVMRRAPARLTLLTFAAALLPIAYVAWLWYGLRTWPRVDPLPSSAPSVVIAMGSNVVNDSTLDRDGALRLREATRLATNLASAKLVTTRVVGGLATSDGGQTRLVDSAGLRGRWLMLSAPVASTHDEALALRSAYPPGTRIVLVTSPLHTRRACATFEHVGFVVTCAASAQYSWWHIPDAYLYERVAWLEYRRRGWL